MKDHLLRSCCVAAVCEQSNQILPLIQSVYKHTNTLSMNTHTREAANVHFLNPFKQNWIYKHPKALTSSGQTSVLSSSAAQMAIITATPSQ